VFRLILGPSSINSGSNPGSSFGRTASCTDPAKAWLWMRCVKGSGSAKNPVQTSGGFELEIGDCGCVRNMVFGVSSTSASGTGGRQSRARRNKRSLCVTYLGRKQSPAKRAPFSHISKKKRAHSHSSTSSKIFLQVGERLAHHWFPFVGLPVGRPKGRIHDVLAVAA
jgi:hypothetical protein